MAFVALKTKLSALTVMKGLFFALISGFLFGCCMDTQGQLLMQPGDSYAYQFSDLEEYGPTFAPPPGGELEISGIEGVNAGDRLRMELFEGGFDVPPIVDETIDLSERTRTGSAFVWADHAGAIRLTAVAGSFTITEVIVRHIRPNQVGLYDLFQLRVPLVPVRITVENDFASLTFRAFIGKRYIVEGSDSIGNDALWSLTGITVENTDTQVTVPAGIGTLSKKYYRVKVEDNPIVAP
jgi:hypothetical protein